MKPMDFIRSWRFAVCVFALLCAAALAGVIYGVLTHEEAGFMERTPGWTPGDFPLDVCVATWATAPAAEPEHTEHLAQNLSLLNDRLDFQVFRRGQDACDVLVLYAAPVDSRAGGEVLRDVGGSALIRDKACEVSLVAVSGELRSLVLQHELGHCLGLEHDDFESSIMRREQRPTARGQYPAQITDSDRALIRAAYAGLE